MEEETGGGKHLVFKLTQSDSHSLPFRSFTLPIDTRSIAGFVAATGETLNIEDAYQTGNLPIQLNTDFDEKFGYRTKSMLVVPMKNRKGEVIGVLQLVNAKRHREVKLTSAEAVAEEVISFTQLDQKQVSSLASQAAVALENNLLYRDIEKLFEGFVRALLTLMESRDPTSMGHTERVAKLTVGLAEVVDRCDSGPYKDIHFTREDIREIQYASVLFDIGKICMREEVLVKAKKLYPTQLAFVQKRFDAARKAIENDSLRKKLAFLERNGNQNFQDFFDGIDAEQRRQFETLEEFLQCILQANEPTVLPEKTAEKLREIAGWSFDDPSGPAVPLLTPEELQLLSIRMGHLNPEERLQIESHVIHSFRFIRQIPWTKELKRIPEIARAHHEKLDGSGYPFHMKGDQIPIQSRTLAISDIFDALTARDKPYKRVVPVDRALDIIGQEVKSNRLDPELFRLFVDANVYQLTARD